MSVPITFVGRLGGDPELRFTPQGKAVASFSVVTDKRRKNGDEWESVDTTWWRCSVWEQQAEHVVESLVKGQLVIVSGHAYEQSWEQDGSKRTRIEVRVEHIGPSLKAGPAKQRKTERAPQPQNDPWNLTQPDGNSPPF